MHSSPRAIVPVTFIAFLMAFAAWRRRTRPWASASLALALGCSQPPQVPDASGGGLDADVRDDAAVGTDAVIVTDTMPVAVDVPVIAADVGADALADLSPDASGEPCPSEGARRRLPCECSATRQESCTGGYWVPLTPCDYECRPGDMEHIVNPKNCSESDRVCNDSCRWGRPEYTVLPGECEATGGDHCDSSPPYNCHCTDACTCIDVPGCPYMRRP